MNVMRSPWIVMACALFTFAAGERPASADCYPDCGQASELVYTRPALGSCTVESGSEYRMKAGGALTNVESHSTALSCAVDVGPALVSARDLSYVEVTMINGSIDETLYARLCYTDLEVGYAECGDSDTLAPFGKCDPNVLESQRMSLRPPERWDSDPDWTIAYVWTSLPALSDGPIFSDCESGMIGYRVFQYVD